ncbi:MAG: dihydropteroate synthase [Fluviibacter sp.]
MPEKIISCGTHQLAWRSGKPLVMGIVNVTPDSFSGDGLGCEVDAAFDQAVAMVRAGADLVDIGAESTRPGAAVVNAEEELGRLTPLLERLVKEGIPVSVDTYKSEVMAEAIRLGAGLINDISAPADAGADRVLAPHESVSVCLMHMQGSPQTMQHSPVYEDVVTEVNAFLYQAVARATAAGIERKRLILDPGFGFGKTFAHNQILFRALPKCVALGFPVLVGVSRKSMIGQITDKSVDQRAAGSVAAALLAAQAGAAIVRVHDVAQTVDALKVLRALDPQTDLESL